MKAMLTLMLLGSLLLAGCAKNAAVDLQSTDTANDTATKTAAPQTAAAASDAKAFNDARTATGDGIQKILFDFDSYLLTPVSKEVLQKNARALLAQPEVKIIIEGHTDERGSSTYNLALGEKRAQAARAYLQTLGIAADRIKVVSYGEEKPALTGSDEGSWAQNRRAEFVPAN